MEMYEKPVVLETEELSEGIYAAGSGPATPTPTPTPEPTPEPTEVPHCDSIYINGVFHPMGDDWGPSATNIGTRGCEGCPATWGSRCAVETYPISMQGQFKPWWEAAGQGPNDPAQPS